MLEAFNGAGVDYLVVGAHAMAVHGLPRATGDFDLFVRCSAANAARVARALAVFGAPAHLSEAEAFSTPDMVVQIGVEPSRVDIMTSISGVEFEEARAERVLHVQDGVAMPCIGRKHLLRNKLASGRKKDLADAEWLEQHEG
ncbi:MAG: hypothetical protein ACYC7F_08095 [Gemmatimonadaceae bacterium]